MWNIAGWFPNWFWNQTGVVSNGFMIVDWQSILQVPISSFWLDSIVLLKSISEQQLALRSFFAEDDMLLLLASEEYNNLLRWGFKAGYEILSDEEIFVDIFIIWDFLLSNVAKEWDLLLF